MIIELRPRRAGKTHDCIKWVMKDTARAMLVAHPRERERIIRTYQFPKDRIFTWREYFDGKTRGRGIQVYCLDNADLFLAEKFKGELGLITLTTNNGKDD